MPIKINPIRQANKEKMVSTLYAPLFSYPLASSYSPQQIQQSTPGQEELDHPYDVLPQQHHEDLQIGQSQNHGVPCQKKTIKKQVEDECHHLLQKQGLSTGTISLLPMKCTNIIPII
jgi:hypothetical protein